MKKIVLASSSPRRRELLKQIGLEFRTLVCPVDETPPGDAGPAELVQILAERKAAAVAGILDDGLVIGADTVVVWNGLVMGKPSDGEDAARMLRLLQGTSHEVYTGVAVIDADGGRSLVGCEKTQVCFRPLEEEEICRYVATGEPMDKAGAYAAQGLATVFISGIKGCYTNVVGLPLPKLAQMLKQFGCRVI
ncbi:MAG TPA: Maf family protein [Bacillota bacterium]|nr:Maf family protein [Bacillota bacterium]